MWQYLILTFASTVKIVSNIQQVDKQARVMMNPGTDSNIQVWQRKPQPQQVLCYYCGKTTDLQIDGKDVCMELDTRAAVSIIELTCMERNRYKNITACEYKCFKIGCGSTIFVHILFVHVLWLWSCTYTRFCLNFRYQMPDAT